MKTGIIISIITTAALVAIWWINGAEREHVWLYIVAIVIAISGIWTSCSRSNCK